MLKLVQTVCGILVASNLAKASNPNQLNEPTQYRITLSSEKVQRLITLGLLNSEDKFELAPLEGFEAIPQTTEIDTHEVYSTSEILDINGNW